MKWNVSSQSHFSKLDWKTKQNNYNLKYLSILLFLKYRYICCGRDIEEFPLSIVIILVILKCFRRYFPPKIVDVLVLWLRFQSWIVLYSWSCAFLSLSRLEHFSYMDFPFLKDFSLKRLFISTLLTIKCNKINWYLVLFFKKHILCYTQNNTI